MPIVILFPDIEGFTAEDEAAQMAEYQAYLRAHPDSKLSFEEWLAL